MRAPGTLFLSIAAHNIHHSVEPITLLGKKETPNVQPQINYNDAWESIPLEFVDDVIEFFNRELQPTHPLRTFKLFPLAKCWRKYKYLIEEEEPSDNLWVLDMDKKKRIKGKTSYYFKRIETQEEIDAILQSDYEDWVQDMKDAGAWHGD